MAGPNRPDESPKDFSFLNADSVSGTPSFPTLDETPGASLPEINFDSSPETVPDLSGLVAETVSFPSAPPHAMIRHRQNRNLSPRQRQL
jgi:hypothetical protein